MQKKDKEHVKEAGLRLLETYYYEKAFFDLALDGALIPRATGPFANAANTRVRKLMRDLEEIVNQYKRQPPTQPYGSQP